MRTYAPASVETVLQKMNRLRQEKRAKAGGK